MQLADVFEDSDAVLDALREMLFQEYLKKLSKLPDWKKEEVEKAIIAKDLTFQDLVRIFDCDE